MRHNLENGLAQLVLTVIDLLRKLMERQAIRRREGGSLSDEEVERLGQTFMKLEEKMKELKETFGLGIATSTATSARWSNCFEKCRAIEDRLQSVCQKTRDLALAMGTAGNDKEADPT
jgi:CRISPR/Cas system-associated endonuclease Cas1